LSIPRENDRGGLPLIACQPDKLADYAVVVTAAVINSNGLIVGGGGSSKGGIGGNAPAVRAEAEAEADAEVASRGGGRDPSSSNHTLVPANYPLQTIISSKDKYPIPRMLMY
jgi:hypothetical protein